MINPDQQGHSLKQDKIVLLYFILTW